MATWTNGKSTVAVERSKVVESNFAPLPVGGKVSVETLQRFGFRKVKAKDQFDAFGRRFRNGETERE